MLEEGLAFDVPDGRSTPKLGEPGERVKKFMYGFGADVRYIESVPQ